MLLLTGATGTIGMPLLRLLTASGTPVRCLVRDPRRLGGERVRVQIALGDLGDPASFRHALRGVETVVHLAAAIRDQPAGSIEELSGEATSRLVQDAEAAGVERFVFFSTLGARPSAAARLLRAKALAEHAVVSSAMAHTIFAPSWVYAPGDPVLRILERLSLLPVMPMPGSGRATSQPIWAQDVAECVMAVLRGEGQARGTRFELAGPEVLSYEQIVRTALRSFHRCRPIVKIPMRALRRPLQAIELLMGTAAPTTWDEVELLEVPMIASRGTTDAERLGVHPKTIAAVLGAG